MTMGIRTHDWFKGGYQAREGNISGSLSLLEEFTPIGARRINYFSHRALREQLRLPSCLPATKQRHRRWQRNNGDRDVVLINSVK